MTERRAAVRQKTFLQGRIYFNNRRSSLDCLIRDISDSGARLRCSEALTVPELMELYIPTREEVHRARVEWRNGDEMGVSFSQAGSQSPGATEGTPGDLAARLNRLESEVAALKRMVLALRSDGRNLRGEVA
ncbi:MAG: PilZ domain-containing protein [Hyphomicrobiales bacterium]|nr:PilZ domain-containing protein [Hyphomicrobiales bacterium]